MECVLLAERETVVKAGECLRGCVSALASEGNFELIDLALEDSCSQSLSLRLQEAAAGDSEAAVQASSTAFMLGMVCCSLREHAPSFDTSGSLFCQSRSPSLHMKEAANIDTSTMFVGIMVHRVCLSVT